MTEIDKSETPKKKKHPFKLVSSNYIFGGIIGLIVIFLNTKSFDLDGYLIGNIIGSLFGVFLFPLLIALFFWFILGRKKNGGTIAFNVMLAIMLFSQFGQYSSRVQENNKTSEDILNSLSEYKESSLEHPDSIDTNYTKFSSSLKGNITNLISNSKGDEKKLFIGLQGYFSKMDRIYKDWNEAHGSLENSKVLDFNYLRTSSDYDSQITIIDNYILKSQNYKSFFLNRKSILKEELKYLNSASVKKYMTNFLKKDSIQRAVFEPYINAHIGYGKNINAILSLLKKEDSTWEYDAKEETILFDYTSQEKEFNTLILEVVKYEEKVNLLNAELYKTM